jgi:hypothetical protein
MELIKPILAVQASAAFEVLIGLSSTDHNVSFVSSGRRMRPTSIECKPIQEDVPSMS